MFKETDAVHLNTCKELTFFSFEPGFIASLRPVFIVICNLARAFVTLLSDMSYDVDYK